MIPVGVEIGIGESSLGVDGRVEKGTGRGMGRVFGIV